MSTSHPKLTFPKRALSVGAAALMLGGTLATAPAITASPDSPFGSVQSAYAAEGALVAPTQITDASFVETGFGFGYYSTKFVTKMNFNGQNIKPGDYFTVGVARGDASTFSEKNTIGGAETFSHQITQASDSAPNVQAVFNGKTLTYTADNSSERVTLQPELTDSVGNVIAALTRLRDGSYAYTFNENVVGKANIEVTLEGTSPIVGRVGYFVNQSNGGAINVYETVGIWTMSPVITQEEANALPPASPRTVYTFPDSAAMPYTLYVSDAKVASVEVNPVVDYVKQPTRDNELFTYNNTVRANSTENPLSGIATIRSPRLLNDAAIGQRVTYTSTITEETRDYLKFVLASGVDPNSLVGIYSVNPGIEIDGKMYPINTDELKAKYPEYASNITNNQVWGNNQATGTELNANSWGSKADTDPYQLQIESITEDSIVWSYVPKDKYEVLTFNIGSNTPDSVVQATLKAVLEQKITNYNIQTTATYPDGSTAKHPGFRSTWNWNSQELRYLLAALANPDESTTAFETPITGKDLIVNDDFTNGAFATGSLEFPTIPEGWTITATPDGKGNATPPAGFAGTVVVPYTTTNEFGFKVQSTWTITVEAPTAKVSVKTFIDGQDANTPVTLTPGNYSVTGTVTNPNQYELNPGNTVVKYKGKVINLPADWKVAPGATAALPAQVAQLPAQGTVEGNFEVTVTKGYYTADGNQSVTASAADPAYAKALTGEITTNPDQVRVRVGEAFSIPLLDNDTTDPAGHPLDPATIKLTATDGWVQNEDGSFTNAELGITGTVVDGSFVGTAGNVEGTFAAPNYTVENTLGDVSELTGITIEVYDFHVDLEALIGEEQQDADGKDDAYTITITDENVETVTTPITLPVTNTGKEPITVTGFQQVNTSDGGDGFEITLDEPVTLAPGESFTYTYDIELPVGEHIIDYKVLTAEGAVATDPVYVDVVKEIVPNEAPSHAVPELTIEPTPEATPETPVVEQEKPKAPAPVVPETGIKGATVEAKTADELAGSDAAVVASAQVAPAGFSVGKVVAGVLGTLAALALTAWGVLTFRNRKAKDA